MKQKSIDEALAVLNIAKEDGYAPDVATYNQFLNYCYTTKDMATAEAMLDAFNQAGLTPDLVTWNIMMKLSTLTSNSAFLLLQIH